MMSNHTANIVDATIESRRSVRAFRNDTVPLETIRHILEVAARAPSSANMQPWRVYVLTGAALRRTIDAVCLAFDTEQGQHTSEYQYFPTEFFEPYLSRRRKMGLSMYALLGIEKGDKERMLLQHRRNYEFFGAPVGLIFTMHRKLPAASFIEYGAFLENIMISARGHGLDTCPQTGWSDYHRVIARELPLEPDEMLIGGMPIGYAASEDPVNQLQTERSPLSEFATFLQD